MQCRKFGCFNHTLRGDADSISRRAPYWNPQGSKRRGAPFDNLQCEIKTIDRTYSMRSSLFAFIFTHNYRTSSLLFISIIITIPPTNKKNSTLSLKTLCVCASLYFTSTLYHYHALKILDFIVV